jgi:hypothetical protein
MTTIEIPADVRDNSEKVTDYAFMQHRSPNRGDVGPEGRDYELTVSREYLSHRHDIYSWSDVNPSGQRCRFDMIVTRATGVVSYLFHTEYFTRVPCITHPDSYARYYASVTDQDGVTTIASPYCGWCMTGVRNSARAAGMTVNESEPLLIGQHD